MLGLQTNERTVGTSNVSQRRLAVRCFADAAVKTRDVAVLGEENVAAFATTMDPSLGNGERIARGVAANHEREPPDIALGGATKAPYAVSRRRLLHEFFVANDFLPNAENIAEIQSPGLMGPKLQVHAIE